MLTTVKKSKNNNVHTVLRRMRESSELTMRQVGGMIGISHVAISQFENQKLNLPDYRIEQLVKAYGYTMDEFNKIMGRAVVISPKDDCHAMLDRLAETEEKKDVIYLDKVGLVPGSTNKIDAWTSAIEDRKPGTKISKRALVNWVIEQMADQPSKAEINMLIEKFYDEERYLKQRIRELREKKNLKGQEQFTDPVEGNDPA